MAPSSKNPSQKKTRSFDIHIVVTYEFRLIICKKSSKRVRSQFFKKKNTLKNILTYSDIFLLEKPKYNSHFGLKSHLTLVKTKKNKKLMSQLECCIKYYDFAPEARVRC